MIYFIVAFLVFGLNDVMQSHNWSLPYAASICRTREWTLLVENIPPLVDIGLAKNHINQWRRWKQSRDNKRTRLGDSNER